jgi:Na+/H+ antiporter NhaC
MEGGLTPNAWYALLPILTIVLGTFAGLLITGWQSVSEQLTGMGADLSSGIWNSMGQLEGTPDRFFGKLGTLIGNSDAYSSLLWSSLTALVLAVLMSVLSGRMKLERSMEALLDGFRTMLGTIIVLILAWSLAKVTSDLHTADMLASLMGEGVPPWAVPAIAFVLAGAVAFSTGSSWGTMAILYPLLLPTAWQIGMEHFESVDAVMPIFYNVTSCVLAGSVLGDHCSPISDTTILSSLASSCDHIAHVRTQMPYALTVGGVALLLGTLPSAFGIPFWITMPTGILVLFGIVHFFGRSHEEELPFNRKD